MQQIIYLYSNEHSYLYIWETCNARKMFFYVLPVSGVANVFKIRADTVDTRDQMDALKRAQFLQRRLLENGHIGCESETDMRSCAVGNQQIEHFFKLFHQQRLTTLNFDKLELVSLA